MNGMTNTELSLAVWRIMALVEKADREKESVAIEHSRRLDEAYDNPDIPMEESYNITRECIRKMREINDRIETGIKSILLGGGAA